MKALMSGTYSTHKGNEKFIKRNLSEITMKKITWEVLAKMKG
jgi:hypothetical protein